MSDSGGLTAKEAREVVTHLRALRMHAVDAGRHIAAIDLASARPDSTASELAWGVEALRSHVRKLDRLIEQLDARA